MAKLTIGDVAEIRALARQAKLLGQDYPEEIIEDIDNRLFHSTSEPMRQMLMKLSSLDLVEELCTQAIENFHAKGEI